LRNITIMLNELKNIVRGIAPALGTVLGGPLGGAAATALSSALLGKPDATQQELIGALQNATPDQIVKIKKIELDYKIELERLKVEQEKMYVDDVKDARKKNVSLARAGIKDNTANYLSYTIIFGYFFIVIYFGMYGVNESSKSLIESSLELLKLMAVGVAGYHFGSSSGSKEKNEMLLHK